MAKVKERAEQGAAQGQEFVELLKSSPYVQRLIADDALRDQLRDAVDSSRSAYKRASKSKNPAKALANDAKLQRELKAAFEAAKDAQEKLRDAPSNPTGKRKRRRGGLLGLLLVGGAATLIFSSAARNKVLDMLFGPEETFDYVPAQNGAATSDAAPPAESGGTN